jgi:hypothetical protein
VARALAEAKRAEREADLARYRQVSPVLRKQRRWWQPPPGAAAIRRPLVKGMRWV